MFVRFGVFNGRKLTAADMAAERRAQRKMALKRRTGSFAGVNRKEQNLDYSQRSFPLREYLMFCKLCDTVAQSSYFGNYILACIIAAGVLVGLQTYPQYNSTPSVNMTNNVILISFTLEVVLKIFGEGMEPYLYFIGKEWKWNVFDFFIVFFSIPFLPFASGQVKLLRLIRLMRLAKVFRKVPQLQMIIMGLVGGLKSIVYIVILMFLVFYLYAIVGVLFFRTNDPWTFHSIEITMLNLLRVATLDGWGDMLFVNYYGCDIYSAGIYTNDRSLANSALGGLTYCSHPNPQPYLATLYFLSFIFLSTFCILSLFIGAISMSMGESMIVMRREKEIRETMKEKEKISEVIGIYKNRENMTRKLLRQVNLVTFAFQGLEMVVPKHDVDPSSLKERYRWFSYRCQDIAESSLFQQFVTGIILLAGVLVGIGTDAKMSLEFATEINFLGQVVQYVFLFELVVKICSEELKPWKYFNDNWNNFDFVVVMASFLPTGSGSAITILRLLRLLRVLKLMRALKQLQVIVTALMDGVTSIGFISLIMMLSYYFFGIIAMTFFSTNDSWHFGTLHMAVLSLFDAATLDGWSSIMYISLYGCEQYSFYQCTQSQPMFAIAALFWVIFILYGSMILLTLFIGVVAMGMEEAKADQKIQAKVDAKVMTIAQRENLNPDTIVLYKEVFDVIDISHSGNIGRDEMKFGLQIAQMELSDEDFEDLWRKVDRDNSNNIDFSEFLMLIVDLRAQFSEPDNTSSGRRVRKTYSMGQPSGSKKYGSDDDTGSYVQSNDEISLMDSIVDDLDKHEESKELGTILEMPSIGSTLSRQPTFHSVSEDFPPRQESKEYLLTEDSVLTPSPQRAPIRGHGSVVIDFTPEGGSSNGIELVDRHPSNVTPGSPSPRKRANSSLYHAENDSEHTPLLDHSVGSSSGDDHHNIAISGTATRGLLRNSKDFGSKLGSFSSPLKSFSDSRPSTGYMPYPMMMPPFQYPHDQNPSATAFSMPFMPFPYYDLFYSQNNQGDSKPFESMQVHQNAGMAHSNMDSHGIDNHPKSENQESGASSVPTSAPMVSQPMPFPMPYGSGMGYMPPPMFPSASFMMPYFPYNMAFASQPPSIYSARPFTSESRPISTAPESNLPLQPSDVAPVAGAGSIVNDSSKRTPDDVRPRSSQSAGLENMSAYNPYAFPFIPGMTPPPSFLPGMVPPQTMFGQTDQSFWPPFGAKISPPRYSTPTSTTTPDNNRSGTADTMDSPANPRVKRKPVKCKVMSI